MKKFKKADIFFIGNFGYYSNQLDGQTLKTRSIHELVCKKLDCNFDYLDTDILKKSNFIIFISLYKTIRAKHVFYLPAYRNLRLFFPLLYIISKIFKTNIHLVTVGGWFENFLNRNKWSSSKLKKVHIIYVQSQILRTNLINAFGFKNVEWIPNFRRNQQVYSSSISLNNSNTFKMVFMSRIHLKKGIGVLFDLLDNIKNKPEYQIIQLDFYGGINESDKQYFEAQVAGHKSASYKGIVDPKEINTILQGYDLLLLPTKYYTEGFPGAILDAYNAGIPVIASQWRYASEFVKDGETGFIIPFDNNLNELTEKIKYLMSAPVELQNMKFKALTFSHQFSADNAWVIIRNHLQSR